MTSSFFPQASLSPSWYQARDAEVAAQCERLRRLDVAASNLGNAGSSVQNGGAQPVEAVAIVAVPAHNGAVG